MKKLSFLVILFAFTLPGLTQKIRIPASYSNIKMDAEKRLYYEKGNEKYYASQANPKYTVKQLLGSPVGTPTGVLLDFGDFKGSITYGLIPYDKADHPLPVFRFTETLLDGKIAISIKHRFKYPYDFVGWSEKGYCTIGYRLIDDSGLLVFDGEVSIGGTGPFEALPTLYEGPFVNQLESHSAIISFETSMETASSVEINGNTFSSNRASTHHEIKIKDLAANTKYEYTVRYGKLTQTYHLTTAPLKGSSEPFVFAYTSDSRHATGGGERKIFGANAYITKKMAAVAYQEGAAFVQFTGDMINGYLNNNEEQMLQYTNWKKSIEVFWHYIPFYVGLGNHEALGYTFFNAQGQLEAFIDGFPYETFSAEAAMSEAFVNPENGPASEDDSKYDPKPKRIDFPSYKENVFFYTYANLAMVVLNSDYWYAPFLDEEPGTSGGLHGYIMDNQLQWLEDVIQQLEADVHIDHVFVTQHTPVFPNGGHSRDDMWYSGNNAKRPFIAGKPVDKGILERRDEYLDILINKSTKVVAILTGDEHNYNWLKITSDMPKYPDDYPFEKLTVSRPIYQINNGACGAPYYAQEKLPWSDHVQSFSVENAVCLFHVNGKSITMRVINPDTLNQIDELKLK
jgi:3',5'-cyclic AMP phosphodiesterase CpdA